MLKRIYSLSLVFILSFTLLFNSFTSNYYKAAEVIDVTVWTLLETLFLSLGVTFSFDGDVDKSQIDDAIVSDMLEIAEGIENGTQKGALLEAADCIGNLINYWDDVTGLTIPQTIWEGLKYYVGYEVAPRPIYKPNSDINLYGCSLNDFITFWSNYTGLSPSDTLLNKFCNAIYDTFVLNDYCLHVTSGQFNTFYNEEELVCIYVSLHDYGDFSFYERSSSIPDQFYFNALGSTYSSHMFSYAPISLISRQCTTSKFKPSYTVEGWLELDMFFIAHGQIYSTFDVCSFPNNPTTSVDYGTSFSYSDVEVPEKEIYTGVIANAVESILDVTANAYDILVDGRTWDEKENKVVGDVVLPIPSQELLDMYYQGLITWQELLESMGITPVNTETGETLDGEAISDIITDSLPDIFDGITDLFIPSDGFFEDFFTRLNDFLDEKLGLLYAPFSLLIDLLTAILNADTSNSSLYFPGIFFEDYVIVPAQSVNLDSSKYIPELKSTCHFITNVIMSFSIIALLQDKLKEVMYS